MRQINLYLNQETITNLRYEVYPNRDLPPGEWTNEPDKIVWYFPQYNLMGMIVRSKRSGHLCGYIGVPEGHSLHGLHYNEASGSVHGGWTYGNSCGGHICHDALPGEPEHVYWFGFDCAQSEDLSPKLPYTTGTYKNIYYVAKELAEVAPELAMYHKEF